MSRRRARRNPRRRVRPHPSRRPRRTEQPRDGPTRRSVRMNRRLRRRVICTILRPSRGVDRMNRHLYRRPARVKRCRRRLPVPIQCLPPRRASACRRLFRNWLNIRRLGCRYRLTDLQLPLRTHRSRRPRSRPRRPTRRPRISRSRAVAHPNCRLRAAVAGVGLVTVVCRKDSRRTITVRTDSITPPTRAGVGTNIDHLTTARLTDRAMGALTRTLATATIRPLSIA